LCLANGSLKEKSNFAGRITAISRQSQALFPSSGSNKNNNDVSVIVQLSNDEQIVVKKVGNVTVALNETK
jgi:hypothetical protein